MTLLAHKQFAGEFPRMNAHDLPVGAAQSATNCDFTQGNLSGLRERAAVPGITAPNAKSLFVYEGLTFSYYSWARDVDAVRGPITSDAYARFYWADGTNFWVSRGDLGGQGNEPSSTNRYWVGVPQPTAPLVAATVDNKFTILGQRPYLYGIFCEGTDGSRKGYTMLNGTYASDTTNAATITANVALVCSTFNIASQSTITNGEWESSTTTTPAVTYEPVVEVRIPVATGGYMSALLRQDPNKNTYPSEAAGMTGSFTYSGNALTVNLSTRSDYKEARAYTYTYVNQYGEEGPPANPLVVDLVEGQKITLRYTPPPTANWCPMTRVRIYRTATGSGITEYLYVGEVTVNSSNPTFVDDVKGDALGESIQTRDYYPPPQSLRGICSLPNGVLCGFKGNEVWFSEPYLPYAWKPTNTQALQNNVIGLCAYEGGVYATTTAHPVLIAGTNPNQMGAQKIPAIQAGVSKGSIVNAGPFAVYASHDGLVTIRGIDASLDLSFKFFTREQWRNLYANKLSLMRLNAHDGHLIAWFTDGTPGFLIRMDEATPSFTKLSDPIYSATVHPQADALYLGMGSTIYEFKSGSNRLSWSHWGKDYILAKQENLGAVQLVGGGSVTMTVYADGAQVFQTLVNMDQTGSTVVRLPSGFRARRWSFKLDGQTNSFVYEMNVVTSPAELQGV